MATATGYLTFGVGLKLLIADSHFTDQALGELRENQTHTFNLEDYLSNAYDEYEPAISAVNVELQENSDPDGTANWGNVSDADLDTEMTVSFDTATYDIDLVIPEIPQANEASFDTHTNRFRIVVTITQPDN